MSLEVPSQAGDTTFLPPPQLPSSRDSCDSATTIELNAHKLFINTRTNTRMQITLATRFPSDFNYG